MTFDLARIFESKRAYRSALAARPIGEKLRLLDALSERELAMACRFLSSWAPVGSPDPSAPWPISVRAACVP